MSKYKHPIAEANETSPFGSLSPAEFYAHHSVDHGSEYITSKQNLKLFTQWWTPKPQQSTPLKGIVCVVHGYTGESSWFVQLTAVHVAKHGFAVCAVDHMGHGYSEGLVAHVPDINLVVDDCVAFFDGFRAKHAADLPAFLYAESLGGAIALLITLRREGIVPERKFDGVVLNGAMCGISDKFKPPWPLEHFLSVAAFLIPTWCVVPTRGSLPNVSFKWSLETQLAPSQAEATSVLIYFGVSGGWIGRWKLDPRYDTPRLSIQHAIDVTAPMNDPDVVCNFLGVRYIHPDLALLGDDEVEWKRKLALASPRRPLLRPRAATAQELLRVCREVQDKFSQVDVPFLIVHGGGDIVCDPSCAEELYHRAASKDKTLRIYPGMWHQLVGEPDESVELVFGEVVGWLLARVRGRGLAASVDGGRGG